MASRLLQLVVICIESRDIRLETLAYSNGLNHCLDFASCLDRGSIHHLPVIENALWERLSLRMPAKVSVEAEGLADRQIRLDSEHRRAWTLLFAEHLTTPPVQAAVDTADGILGALDFDEIDGLL